ncbi:MAG: hypothetical protein R3F03_14115 [Opitutaceae bacterium]
MAARTWFLVAAGAVTLCALQPYLLVRAYRSRERVVVMDAGNTFHVSPLLQFEEADRLHEQHALLACLALLQLNPAGFDQPELLEKLFLPEALQQARHDWAARAEEFGKKQLHQKAEVRKLTVLETREETVIVQAEGQLLRTGLLGAKTFTEAPTFTATFTFARNPNLAANGRFPLAVWQYELAY